MLPTKGGKINVPLYEIVVAVSCFVAGVFAVCKVVTPPDHKFVNFWSILFLVSCTIFLWSLGLAIIVN
jgi:hypothetical protein